MKRTDMMGREIGSPQAIETFLGELVELCKRSGVFLSHEDSNGAFVFVATNNDNESAALIEWLRGAHLEVSK